MADAIGEYVDELGHALRGPRHARADLLVETRDSLQDAAAAYEAAGMDRPSAERTAVADFGEVREVAPAYQSELAFTQSRRTAWLLVLVVALQPLVWQSWWPWWGAPSGDPGSVYAAVNEGVEWVGGLTIALSLLTALMLGAGCRYVDIRNHGAVARYVGVGALVLCGVFASLGVVMSALSPSQTLVTGLLWLTPFLLLPLAAVAGAARSCLRLA